MPEIPLCRYSRRFHGYLTFHEWRLPALLAAEYFKRGAVSMTEVVFLHHVDNELLKFAVIVSRYQGKWVLCRRKGAASYEVPGGYRKETENIEETARRELYEETGAARFRMTPVGLFSIRKDAGYQIFGMLYFAEVQEFFALPNFEMDKIEFFTQMPGNLTFPDVDPALIRKVAEVNGMESPELGKRGTEGK